MVNLFPRAAVSGTWSAPAPCDALAPLRLWHLASLDAPTVAVVWCWAFAWTAKVSLPSWAPILLALVAWTIYIGDRLLDARAGMQSPPRHLLRDRHHFHWRHRWKFAPLAAVAALTGAAIVFTRLPAVARVPDSAVAAATLAYFSGIHSRRKLPPAPPVIDRVLAAFFSREVLIGVLFTAACLLPLCSQVQPGPASIPTFHLLALPSAFFATLAWLNCFAISRWESAPQAPRPILVHWTALILASVGVLVACSLLRTEPRAAVLLFSGAVSALLLALLNHFRSRLAPVTLRAAADLVLLTPVFLPVFTRLH